MRQFWLAFVAVSSLTVACASQVQAAAPTTQPVDAVAEVLGHKTDFSTPKKTMETLADSLRSQNTDQIRDCLYIADQYKSQANIMLGMMSGSLHLKKVIQDKFGEAAANEINGGGNPLEVMANRLKAVDDSAVVVKGDVATMTLQEPNEAATPGSGKTSIEKHISFLKVDGNWKINANEMMMLDDVRVQKILPTLGKISKVMETLATDIETNRITSVQEVKQSLTRQFIMIMQEARTMEAAATQKASTTAPAK